MSDSEKKPVSASFGKLFLAFLMIMLLALAFISMQTADKLKSENEKATEEYMSSQLDEIVSKTFHHEYMRRSIANIIEIARNEGPESNNLKNAVEGSFYNDGIGLKAYFYRNNELVQSINTNKDDIEDFKDLFKNLAFERTEPGYAEANRAAHSGLTRLFGTGNRLELFKLRKNFYTNFKINNYNQNYYWNTYDNGIGVFIYSTKFPDFIERFQHVIKKMEPNKFGAISSENKQIAAPEGFTEDQTLLAYIKTTKSNKPFIVSNDNYWYFQTNRLGNKVCYTIPQTSEPIIEYDWAEHTKNISAILFIFVFILYVTSLFNIAPGKNAKMLMDSLSIRYRIIGIFTMASVFPVLMTAIIGASVMADKQSVIEKNILSESMAAIYNMENQANVLLEKTEKMANDIREGVKEAYLTNRPINTELFYRYLNKYQIAEGLSRLDIRDGAINTILTLDDREIHGAAETLDIICRIVLKLHSPERVAPNLKFSPGEMISESVVSTDEVGFATIIRQRGKQWLFRIGAFPTTWYWDTYPDLATGPAFICVVTQMITTFEQHMENYIKSTPAASDSFQIAAHLSAPHTIYRLITNAKNLPQDEIFHIANASFDTNKVLFRSINIDNKPYWITCKHEKQVGSHAFMHLIAKNERLAVLEPFKWQLILVGLFALFISIFGAWFITNLVILPVGDLSKGIMAIRQRDKEFTIPIRRNDEFGKLANEFNRVIGELEELEYGKIVQESLMPQKPLEIEGYDICYFHVSATDLAGDYHDDTVLDDGRCAIILGDVSGHGISAALAMAMAKATFNYAKSKKVKFPEELLDMLNTIFNRELKPRNKLMTLISIVLDPKTGEVMLDNAGQAYPCYYTASTRTSAEIPMPSLPLGGMKKRKHKGITKQMESGDAFILYTDGIIEVTAPNGEMFGYERFYNSFTEMMQNGVESKEALNTLFQKMEAFREAGPRPDDVTMIIVKKL